MPFATYTARIRRMLAEAAPAAPRDRKGPRRRRVRVPERALLGAMMTGALVIVERRLNRTRNRRDARRRNDGE